MEQHPTPTTVRPGRWRLPPDSLDIAELGPTAGEFHRLSERLHELAFTEERVADSGYMAGEAATSAIATPLHATAGAAEHLGGILTVAAVAGGHAAPPALASIDATARMLGVSLDRIVDTNMKPHLAAARSCARDVLTAIRCCLDGEYAQARKWCRQIRDQLDELAARLAEPAPHAVHCPAAHGDTRCSCGSDASPAGRQTDGAPALQAVR